jgi:hypothetical protein
MLNAQLRLCDLALTQKMLNVLGRWVGGRSAYGIESVIVMGGGFGALFGEGLAEKNAVSLNCEEKERDVHGHGRNANMRLRGA